MLSLRRLLSSALLATTAFALVGADLAVPASAARTTTTASSTVSAVAARPKPCGVKHYPPCPPKPVIKVPNRKVKRGHRLVIEALHFTAHAIARVHIGGHGKYRSLGTFRVNKKGNLVFKVTIPKRFKPGLYHLYVRVGSTLKSFIIRVKR